MDVTKFKEYIMSNFHGNEGLKVIYIGKKANVVVGNGVYV